jgi:hypothetical protein
MNHREKKFFFSAKKFFLSLMTRIDFSLFFISSTDFAFNINLKNKFFQVACIYVCVY